MSWLVDYWWLVVVLFAGGAVAGVAIYNFLKAPTTKQLEVIKDWLLYWVLQAEATLGGGTGKIKLSMVYDVFVQRFPWLAKIITYDTFGTLVDAVLEKMRGMLQSNPALLDTVKSTNAVIIAENNKE